MNSISEMQMSRLLSVACKSMDEKACPWEKELSRGEFLHFATNERFEAAQSTVPESNAERLELRRILKYRKKIADYALQSHLLDLSFDKKEPMQKLLRKIFQDIAALSQTITQEPKRTSFCFPGGTENHAVCFEVAKETNGTYSFLIYNKGEGVQDIFFHSSICLKKGTKIITRTRVQILNLLKTDLTSIFFEKLFKITIHPNQSMNDVYRHIKRHLIDGKQSFIRKPYWECQWDERGENFSPKEHRYMKKALLNDPDFHPVQTQNTCVENNMQTPEHFLASRTLRIKLKLTSLERCASLLRTKLNENNKLKKLYSEKISDLKSKLMAIK